ncbi:MAG: type II toxin-antitoxin system VapC family toxin [Candidatus Velthaea sp.]
MWLWLIGSSKQLGRRTRALLENRANGLVLSVASAWEIALKVRLGKLDVGGDVESFLRSRMHRTATDILNVEFEHIVSLASLPSHHRDPFDRLLVAQAKHDGLPMLSADPWLRPYGIELLDPAQ